MSINNLLLKRISGGPKNQMNKSNNNIRIRNGATQFIKYLYDTDLFHIAFFTSMHETNAYIAVKKLLNGKNTGISIDKNISILSGKETTVYLEANKFYLIKHKSELIEKVNNKLNNNLFNTNNTLIIDHLNQENIIDEKINIYIPAIDNKCDNWINTLQFGINSYLSITDQEVTISTYMREFILIVSDIISSTT